MKPSYTFTTITGMIVYAVEELTQALLASHYCQVFHK